MKCKVCSTDNSDGTIYCEGCGSALDITAVSTRPSPDAVVKGAAPVSKEEVSQSSDQELGYCLTVIRGNARGRSYSLEQGTNLIGRWDPDTGAFPEIDLESEDLEAKVSRKHAVIECRGVQIIVRDIGSLNGTFVNRGPRLEKGKDTEIQIGDELIVGKTFLKLEKGRGE